VPWQDAYFAVTELVGLALLLWQARDARTQVARPVSLLYVAICAGGAIAGFTLGWVLWPLVSAAAAVAWLAMALARAPPSAAPASRVGLASKE